MNQPILDRPMFQGVAPTVSPMGSPMGGVGSITTPDQNATALRNMFAPQPSAQPAPQGYRRGGEIINGVAHFAGGNEVVVPSPPPAQEDPETARILEGGNPRPPQNTPTESQFQRDLGRVGTALRGVEPTQAERDAALAKTKEARDAIGGLNARARAMAEGRDVYLQRAAEAPPRPSYFGSSTTEEYDAHQKALEDHRLSALA